MALRDQPYLPLYVQDFLTDEKLSECGAESTGVYIRLMCLMHKSEEYGVIKLKAKYKQNKSKLGGFAEMLTKQMPYSADVIERALEELLEEKVCYLDGDSLCQKRMMKDGNLSSKRALAGAKGGKSVKNSPTRALYNEPGYIYLFAENDIPGSFKLGISKDPQKRLQNLSSASGKELSCVYTQRCSDMGDLESRVLLALEQYRDGEWISGIGQNAIIGEIQKQMQTKKQKTSKKQANTESESESENEYENDTESEGDNEDEETPSRAGARETTEPPLIILQLNTGEGYPITPEQAEEWAGLYPAVDVIQQLRAMKGWLKANPKKRKTRAGILRFVNAWLAREQDKGGVRLAAAPRTSQHNNPPPKNIYAELAEKARAEEEHTNEVINVDTG